MAFRSTSYQARKGEKIVNLFIHIYSRFESTASQKRAREVMGNNFFGIEDWFTFYGVNFSRKQLRGVAEFPWSEGVLNSTCPLCGKIVKDCHFAFLGVNRLNGNPLTIIKFQELHPITAQPRFCSYAPGVWYSKEKFATENTMDLQWHLFHRNIVFKLVDTAFDEQKKILPAEYEVPSAIAEVAKDLLVFKKIGAHVNPLWYSRCVDVASDGRRIYTGFYGGNGLFIGCIDDNRYDNIGLAASRKF